MSDETYNGWANYETWAVHLWLTNEEPSYYGAREAAADGREALQAFAEDYCYSALGDDDPPASLAFDLLRSSMSAVNWGEIYAALTE